MDQYNTFDMTDGMQSFFFSVAHKTVTQNEGNLASSRGTIVLHMGKWVQDHHFLTPFCGDSLIHPVSTEEWTLDESMTQKLSMSQHKLSKKTHLCSLKKHRRAYCCGKALV